MRATWAEWYRRNRADQQAKARTRAARYRSLNRRLRTLILSALPCMDCGEPPNPDIPFEFDHRDGIAGSRSRRMSSLVSSRSNHHEMMRELPFCDVVCANCHKRRTYDRAGW
jgi:hypothetical protein